MNTPEPVFTPDEYHRIAPTHEQAPQRILSDMENRVEYLYDTAWPGKYYGDGYRASIDLDSSMVSFRHSVSTNEFNEISLAQNETTKFIKVTSSQYRLEGGHKVTSTEITLSSDGQVRYDHAVEYKHENKSSNLIKMVFNQPYIPAHVASEILAELTHMTEPSPEPMTPRRSPLSRMAGWLIGRSS